MCAIVHTISGARTAALSTRYIRQRVQHCITAIGGANDRDAPRIANPDGQQLARVILDVALRATVAGTSMDREIATPVCRFQPNLPVDPRARQ